MSTRLDDSGSGALGPARSASAVQCQRVDSAIDAKVRPTSPWWPTMRMTIVRHALARDKKSWPGPDLERPLDPMGERQAAGMARVLMEHKVRRIISSPAIRCVQTMQPLADAANVPIELCDDLGREATATPILAAFTDPDYRDAVLCTHGEVLHQLLLADNVRRMAHRGRLSTRRLLIKGSAWRMEITTSGRVSKLNHLRPIK